MAGWNGNVWYDAGTIRGGSKRGGKGLEMGGSVTSLLLLLCILSGNWFGLVDSIVGSG